MLEPKCYMVLGPARFGHLKRIFLNHKAKIQARKGWGFLHGSSNESGLREVFRVSVQRGFGIEDLGFRMQISVLFWMDLVNKFGIACCFRASLKGVKVQKVQGISNTQPFGF